MNSRIFRSENDLYNQLEQSASSQISDLLLQPVFVCSILKTSLTDHKRHSLATKIYFRIVARYIHFNLEKAE
jgi:hypothetical protein